MDTTAYCKETITTTFTGAGAAGVHSREIVLPAGRFSITAAKAGTGTLSIQLKDASGNAFDIPDPQDNDTEATLPGTAPVEFSVPGLTLVLEVSGADGTYASTVTVGPIH